MKKIVTTSFLSLFILLMISSPLAVYAHPLSASYGKMTISENMINYTFSIDDISVMESVAVDSNNDLALTLEELEAGSAEITEWISRNLVIQVDGVSQRLSFSPLIAETRSDKNVITTTISVPLQEAASVTVHDSFYTDPKNKTSYTQLLTIDRDGQVSEAILKGDNRTWEMNLSEPSTSSVPWLSFLILGMEHIITGYDHLLFLLALLLARQSFKDYIKVVTAFTVAHSITITLGYLNIINLPSILVESVIALSICYVAIENIFRKKITNRWGLTFAFGLIHGLGFAGILHEMVIPKEHLAIALLSFNVGIEIAQIALVALVIPILSKVQALASYPKAMKLSSSFIILIGAYWVIERVFQW